MSTEWLDELEEKVRGAVERIGTLEKEKTRLAQQVEELEERLAAAEEAGVAAWKEEREEIRGRVEGLTAKLEGLLED